MRTFACLVLCALSACGEESAPAQAPGPAAEPTRFVSEQADPHMALGPQLARHAALARQQHLTPYVELSATWCGPCRAIERSMGDERMQNAFRGTYVVHVDIDAFATSLESTGLETRVVPKFVQLGDDGHPLERVIDGGAWGEDIPENMAPVLDRFFHASAVN